MSARLLAARPDPRILGRRQPKPYLDRSSNVTRRIVVDTETTGLSPFDGDRLTEIAGVELDEDGPTGRMFHWYINPGRRCSPDAIAVHGLTEEFLADKPGFIEIASDVVKMLDGAELIAHNAAFDVSFIDSELRSAGCLSIAGLCSKVTDTLSLARSLHPGKSNSLNALINRYGVTADSGFHFGALLDAHLLAKLYLQGFASLQVSQPESYALAASAKIWTPSIEHELFSYLSKHPRALLDLPPRRFEELVASIFRNNGFSVELTPQTRDGGVDIIAVENSSLTGGSLHLIECKRYAHENKVGIGIVQRLLGAVSQRRATKGILVTTSFFTQAAAQVAPLCQYDMLHLPLRNQ
jgi:DNA polymerase III epsilon subunit